MNKRLHLFAILVLTFFSLNIKTNSQENFGRIVSPADNEVKVLAINGNNLLFAGFWGGGIKISANNGDSWIDGNTGLGNLHINAFAFKPNGATFITFVGTAGGGVYKSTNDGLQWTEVNLGLENLYVKSLAIDHTGVIFAGTYGHGVFRSTDNGDNWEAFNTGLKNHDILSIGISKANVPVLATNGGGIYRSLDSGKTWEKANASTARPLPKYVNSLYFDTDSNLVACTNGAGIFVSGNNGQSWIPYDTLKMADRNITTCGQNENKEYIIGTRSRGIYWYDRDLKKEWKVVDGWRNGINCIVKNKNDVFFAAIPGEGIMRSTSNGLYWQDLSFKKTFTRFYLASNADGWWAVMDNKGLYKSTDEGRSWSLKAFTDQTISMLQATPNRVLVIVNRNIHQSTNGGDTWTQLTWNPGGDTSRISFGLKNNGKLYMGTILPGGMGMPPPPPVFNLFYANSAPGQFMPTSPAITVNCSQFFSTSDGDFFTYVPDSGLLRQASSSDSWDNRYNAIFSGKTVNDIKVFAGKIFLATNAGIIKSSDKGVSYTLDQILYFNFGTDMLEPAIVKSVFPVSANEYYAVTGDNLGTFYTTDNGANWTQINIDHNSSSGMGSMVTAQGDLMFADQGSFYLKPHPSSLVAPQLTSPANNAFGQTLAPQITWNESEKADLYELQIGDIDDFSFINDELLTKTTTYDVIANLKYNTKYYWRVRSRRFETGSNWVQRSFTTKLAPVSLSSPESGSIGMSKDVLLEWNPVEGATLYDLEIALDENFTNIFKKINGIADTSTTVDSLQYLTKYYWKVKARNTNNFGDFSAARNFTIKLPPPVLIFPENDAANMPTAINFKWKKSNTAEAHFIQISKFEDFSINVLDIQTQIDSVYYFDFLEYQSCYFWRVYSMSESDTSEYSETWKFCTGIQGVTLISPENKIIKTDKSMQLVWDQFPSADSYDLQVSVESEFQTLLINEEKQSVLDYQLNGLEDFTTYYWRVRANLGTEVGNWSDVWSFRTKMGMPVVTAPENASINIPLLSRITWQSLKGAESYTVNVSQNIDFNELDFEKANISLLLQDVFLSHNTQYYLRVRGVRSDEDGDWTAPISFKTLDTSKSSVEYTFNPDGIKLYPNPANSELFIEFENPDNIYNVLILSTTGEVLAELKYENMATSLIKFDSQSLPQGSYFALINTGKETLVKEFKIVR